MSRATLSRPRRRRFCTAGHIVHVADPDVFLAVQGAMVMRPAPVQVLAVVVDELVDDGTDADGQLACADCGALAGVDARGRCAECARVRRVGRYRPTE